MPTVPDTPAVSVLQQGSYGTIRAGAPDFDRSFVNYGRALGYAQDAFRVMRSIKEKQKKDQDDANVRMAVDAYYLRSHSYAFEDGGPLNQMGTQVMTVENGLDYMGRVRQSLTDIANQVATDYGINTDQLRKRFDEGVLGVDKSFIPTFLNHEADERHKVIDESYENTRNRVAQQVSKGEIDADPAYRTIRSTIVSQMRHNGHDVNSPSAKYLIEAQTRDTFTKAVQQYGLTALAANEPERFELYLSREGMKGTIDPDARDGMLNAALQAMRLKEAGRRSDEAAWRATNARTDSWILSQAAFDGTFDAAFTGQTSETAKAAEGWQGNPDREAIYQQDGIKNLIRTAGSTEAAMGVLSVYRAGGVSVEDAQRIVNEAIEKAKSDKDGNPANYRKYLPEAAQGQLTTIERRFAEAKTRASEPVTYADIIQDIRTRHPYMTPEESTEAAALAFTKVDTMAKIREAQQQAIYQQAMQNAFRGNLDFTSVPQFAMLEPQYQGSLFTLARRLATGADDVSDQSLFYDLNANPQRLKAMTDLDFLRLRSSLSQEDYVVLERQRRAAMQGGELTGDVNYSEIKRSVDNWALRRNMDLSDKQVKTQLGVLEMVVAERARQVMIENPPPKGGNSQQWYENITNTILNADASMGSKATPLGNLQPNKISDENVAMLEKAFGKRAGSLEGTPELLSLYADLRFTPSLDPGDAVPLPDAAKIRNAIAWRSEGRLNPDNRFVALAYFEWKQNNVEWMRSMFGPNWRRYFSDEFPLYSQSPASRYGGRDTSLRGTAANLGFLPQTGRYGS